MHAHTHAYMHTPKEANVTIQICATCVGILSVNRCPPLADPADGMVSCSLGVDRIPTNSDTCDVTCDDGFDLSGSSSRTCQVQDGRGSWSGVAATCRGKLLIYIYVLQCI